MPDKEKLIEIKDLQITFGSGRKKFVAVDHVNIDIYKGETFSLVGESGSGKTTIGRYDTSVVQACVIVYAGLGILGVFLGDVMMMLFDPRIKLVEGGESR